MVMAAHMAMPAQAAAITRRCRRDSAGCPSMPSAIDTYYRGSARRTAARAALWPPLPAQGKGRGGWVALHPPPLFFLSPPSGGGQGGENPRQRQRLR